MSIYSRGSGQNHFNRHRSKWGSSFLGAAMAVTLSLQPAMSGEKSGQLAISATDYPIVESANLDTNLDVPWSEPVIVQDPFEGEFIGIFDRHFFSSRVLNTSARLEVVSLWSLDTVRFLLAYRDRDCNFGSTFYHQTLSRDCLASNAALKITDVYLKLGEEVFRLESNNSRFEVDEKLATALKNSPSGNVDIRLIVENGETVDSEIGEETVKAWQFIY
ncbi:conserved hypothetical protein [Hyella patelloides LEGE 07179]|uniref:Uncharacterized protein n=1 Tax=Hyella patelloides LEGE 07179 TaxID=945734 RepID=A0A563VNI7_9CYAN|nr:hypothetical protein [Hyella patelloides]VEP12972.1 conserved hypothetical protein [Hyella patelloides LEGE 07179]